MRRTKTRNTDNDLTLFSCPKCGKSLTTKEALFSVCLDCKNGTDNLLKIDSLQKKANDLLAEWKKEPEYLLNRFTYGEYVVTVTADENLVPVICIQHAGYTIYSPTKKTETGEQIFSELLKNNLIKIQTKNDATD